MLHVDMDAFFAAVEQLTRPTLRDRPVLVGGLGPRAVVAGASYQARAFGVRSAMPMGQARRLCPLATVLPPRGRVYRAVSEQVMAVLGEVAPVVEPVSLDEAFLEPPALRGAGEDEVCAFAERLRTAIRDRTGLTASVGAGSGKQLAKIASELAKPDGLRVIPPGTEREVLAPLPVRALWGVGPVAETALRRVGVHTIGELAAMDVREVTDVLGTAAGAELHQLARGVDDRPVTPPGPPKQVSSETTFDTDLTTMPEVLDAVARITAAAHRRLLGTGRAARTVSVKIRSADFTTTTRAETSPVPTTELGVLVAVAQRLAEQAVPAGGVRLIGVSLAGLTDPPPPALFDPPTPSGVAATAPVTDLPDGTDVDSTSSAGPRPWRTGDDVHHREYGHGWVQGAGHGVVTVRFETRSTGPGPMRTLSADDPDLRHADPLDSLA